MNDIELALEDLKDYIQLWEDEQADEDLKVIIYKNTIEHLKIVTAALEKQLTGGWVPVSERLPERDFKCLVTTENNEIFGSEFYGYGEEYYGYKEYPDGVWEIDAYGETVIAWQPLPEPYKEVHHAISLEEDFDKRLDNDNLITLCEEHHEQAERGEIPRAVILKIVEEKENE